MLESLQYFDFSDQSPRSLLVAKHTLEPFACVVSLTRLVQDVHDFAVDAFAKLSNFSEVWRQNEV